MFKLLMIIPRNVNENIRRGFTQNRSSAVQLLRFDTITFVRKPT